MAAQKNNHPVLEAVDLHKVYGKKKVLGGVSLRVYAGECLGIFGLRAAGKTTLLHILAGLEKTSTGSVLFLGSDINKSRGYKAALGLMTQSRSLFQDLSAAENLDFIASLKGTDPRHIAPLVDKFRLQDYLPEPVKSLDEGVYQRLALACGLLNVPQVLIMDEPIKDIDLESRQIIIGAMQDFAAQGGACVQGFSNMEFAPYMSRVGWLDQGRIKFYEPLDAQQAWENLIQSYRNRVGEQGE